ncbi:MAG: hypothetical protein ACK4UJ_07005 [Leptonema sp. (in: bacteria)]
MYGIFISIVYSKEVNLYYYNFPFLNIEEIGSPLILKKNRDYYNRFYKISKSESKDEMYLFFIDFPYKKILLLDKEKKYLKEYYNFYLDVLSQYSFDGIPFFAVESEFLNQEILPIIEKIKPFKEKIICFDCLESFGYLYKIYTSVFYKNIKITSLFFKNCPILDDKLKKLWYLEEDSNLWNFFLEENCVNYDFLEKLKREKSKNFFIFMIGKNEFYKIKKNSDIYICKTEPDYFCKISIRFRENTILSVEQNFIRLSSL